LGGRKGGLGASKVSADFSAIESAAEQHDRDQALAVRIAAEDAAKQKQLAEEEEVNRLAAMRLAYQDISVERQKKEAKLKLHDPQKAEQLERLGMGSIGLGNKGISHSALSGMKIIEQEGDARTGPSGLSTQPSGSLSTYDYLDKSSRSSAFLSSNNRRGGGFDGDEELFGGRNTNSSARLTSGFDSGSGVTMSSTSAWERDLGSLASGARTSYTPKSNDPWEEETSSRFGRGRKSDTTTVSSEDVQKRFGNAKGISSDAFFGHQDNDGRASLARFEGSSAISSDDVFGTGQKHQTYSSGYYSNMGDLNDIKDGVRQGVSKVAGKLSTIASGVVSSLQDRYGHY
jgi:ADP-ribosylation factor GTPase-activating protein 2/3